MSKMQRVQRVQQAWRVMDKDGVGPFNSEDLIGTNVYRWAPDIHYVGPRFPSPFRKVYADYGEDAVDWALVEPLERSSGWVLACPSVESLEQWFPPSVWPGLMQAGYGIYTLEVLEDDVITSPHQCIVKYAKIITITPTFFVCPKEHEQKDPR